MRADKFAKKIINNLKYDNRLLDFEYILLKELCFFSNRKKVYPYYIKGKTIFVCGISIKYEVFSKFFDNIGIKYEIIANKETSKYGDFKFKENNFVNHRNFFNIIRNYYIKKYNYMVRFTDCGEIYYVTNCFALNKQNLLNTIKLISEMSSEL